MKRKWEGEKRFYLLVLFLLIIASFVLLTDSKGNGKTISAVRAGMVLNKEDAKTVDTKKDATEDKELDKADKIKIQESYGKLPLYFIANKGQVDKKVKFYEKGGGHTAFFTKEGVYFSLNMAQKSEVKNLESENSNHGIEPPNSSPKESAVTTENIKLAFLNANKNPEIIAESLQEDKVNYFIGKDSKKWRTNIPTYQAVVYKEVYKGIDIKFYGSNRQLEYDIIVKPGADPTIIKFSYEGIKGLKVAENGDLEIILNSPSPLVPVLRSSSATEDGGDGKGEGAKLIQKKPYVYQEINGKRIEVEGKFKIEGSEFKSEETVLNNSQPETRSPQLNYTFQLASYNPDYPLIIDPILVYSTYLGENRSDYGYGIAVDSSGNAYVTGRTYSTGFPTTTGAYDTAYNDNGSYGDVFVTKLSADGTSLVYSTYLGGSGNEYGYGIAIDSSGNAYVTGYTYSTNFPTTTGVYDTASNGNGDAFITKLSADGTSLVYSTYLGGSGNEYGYGIAIDSSGNAYVTGYTNSTNFPTTTGGYDNTSNGSNDVFVTKLSADGTSLVYSTYLGGSGNEYGYGIAIDSSGNAYVTGVANSTNFPTTTGGYDNTSNGSNDVFVTKLNADGTSLVYSTYLGGSGSDYGYGIAIDSSGNAYVTGVANSTDFPTTTGVYDTASNGNGDAFITKLSADGTSLVYSTYLGGGSVDEGYGIAVDSSGSAYITGFTKSTNFPTQSPLQGSNERYEDAFVAKLSADGASLVYSTYLGGSYNEDYGYSIAVDASGNAYVTGYTNSTNFPTTTGAYDNTICGGGSTCYGDAFVAKIGDVSGQYALRVTKTVTGLAGLTRSGTVTSSPAGIDCGNDCYENYAANTVVTLTTTLASGSPLKGWSGDADCSDGVVTMDANKTCTANFDPSFFSLTINKAGTGSGKVISIISIGDPHIQINCGTACASVYLPGTKVPLGALPDSGSYFAGWSGDADCSDTDGVITMDANKTCTATFNTISDSGNTGNGSGGDSGSDGGGGCGIISDYKKGNQPPAAGMLLLLLPIVWLLLRRISRGLKIARI